MVEDIKLENRQLSSLIARETGRALGFSRVWL